MLYIALFIMGLYGYYYYRQCIKKAKELIRIHIGDYEYERLKKY